MRTRPILLTEITENAPHQIQLLRVGDFQYDLDEKLEITADMLVSFKQNFDAKIRGYEDGKLPVDYFHDNDKIAAGWISQLYLQNGDTELWAEVEWTPKAKDAIASRELRYVSAEFHLNYEDNESRKKFGPTLFGAGLTNRPFVKGMKSIAASEKNKSLKDGEKEMTLEEAKAKIKDLEEKIEEMTGKMGEMEKKSGEKDKELEDSEKKYSELEAKLSETKALNEKTNSFNKLLADGKAVEAQREAFMSGDMVKFSELAMPVNKEGQGSSEEKKESEEKTEAKDADEASEKVMELAEKMAKEQGIALDKAISKVLSENKELAEKHQARFA